MNAGAGELTMDFHIAVRNAKQILDQWSLGDRLQAPDFSGFPESIYCKNADRQLTLHNDVFSTHFQTGPLSEGSSDRFLSSSIVSVSRQTDAILLAGNQYVECEHIGTISSGALYRILTHKSRVDYLCDPRYLIFGVSRLLEKIEVGEQVRRLSLQNLLDRFQGLDTTDKMICRLQFQGDGTKEIAESIGLTSRSVELRRQKLLKLFGFERPVEIVKMMVRFEEHGLLS